MSERQDEPIPADTDPRHLPHEGVLADISLARFCAGCIGLVAAVSGAVHVLQNWPHPTPDQVSGFLLGTGAAFLVPALWSNTPRWSLHILRILGLLGALVLLIAGVALVEEGIGLCFALSSAPFWIVTAGAHKGLSEPERPQGHGFRVLRPDAVEAMEARAEEPATPDSTRSPG